MGPTLADVKATSQTVAERRALEVMSEATDEEHWIGPTPRIRFLPG